MNGLNAPDSWILEEISNLCKVKGGKRLPKGSTFSEHKTDYPYIRVTDMVKKSVNEETLKYISQEIFQKIRNYTISSEDAYITIAGTIGLSGVIPEHLNGTSLTENAAKLVIKDKSKLDKKYLVYVLDSKFVKGQIDARIGIVGVPKLALFRIESLKIPIPPLSIQAQIVAILEKAERLKEKREQANQETNKIIQSVFYEMFGNIARNDYGWNELTAEEIFDMKLGKMLSAKNYTGKHLKPYLRNINVQWGSLDLSDIKEMDFDDNEFPRYELKKDDILVCEGGEVGRTAIYNGEIENCCYQNALHRLRIKKPIIERQYFVYYMQFAAKYGLILRDTSQVTIAHFTAEKFKKFKVLLPPIELQNEFASIVEKVESLKERQRQSTQEINTLFDALLQKAFNGELVA